MQQIGIIKEVLPFTERQYTDQNGNPAVFASLPIIICTGSSTMYIEYAQELARSLSNVVKKDQLVQVDIAFRTREWTTQTGERRVATEVMGRGLQPLIQLSF